MVNSNTHELHFPQKIKEEKELIKGLDAKRIIYCVITLAICSIPIVMFYFYTKTSMTSFLIFLITASVIYTLYARLDDSRVAMIDMIKYMLQFFTSPKQYKYHYYHEIVIEESSDEDEEN